MKSPPKGAMEEIDRMFKKRARFLIDESLPSDTKDALDVWGFRSITVHELKLQGRSDEDIFAYAWKDRMYILTADTDFLDNRRFPPNRNPGVIVVPPLNIGTEPFIEALYVAVSMHGDYKEIFRKTKVHVHENGEFEVWQRHYDTEKITKTRYKLDSRGIFEWKDQRSSELLAPS